MDYTKSLEKLTCISLIYIYIAPSRLFDYLMHVMKKIYLIIKFIFLFIFPDLAFQTCKHYSLDLLDSLGLKSIHYYLNSNFKMH